MKKIYWLRISVGLILWTMVIGLFLILYNPLGPQLPSITSALPGIATTTPVGVALPTFIATATGVSSFPATPTFIPSGALATPTATSLPAEVCGRTGAMTFLIVGENPFMNSPARGVNTIRLVKFDFGHKQVNVLSLPPEIWVEVPVLQSHGINRTQLTLVYYESKRLAAGSDREKMAIAVGNLARTVYDNFGFYPDHYLVVKQNYLADMIEVVGGVDIILPVAVDGRSQGRNYYPAGPQHLKGDQVLDLVLILQSINDKSSSEWIQYKIPTLVLQAVNQAVDLPENSFKIPSLMNVFNKAALTDLSIRNILDLTCLVNNSDILIRLNSVGPGMTTTGSNQELLPRVDLLSTFIRENVGK
jgi:anionic cell wall polymer biosynthesis LytR-Cps2A-Psr (LCP) family protein